GGVSSIAIVLEKILPNGFLSVDAWIFILTWSLFFLGLFILGKPFALKTLASSFVYSFGVPLFLKLVDPNVFNGFFCLKESVYSQTALILAALFGGVSVGTGCAVAFLGGGSTGGVDILAFILCKSFKKLKSSVVIFTLDAATVLIGMFVIGDLVLTLLGIVTAFICAVMIDRVFLGGSKAFIAQIVSDQYEEINAAVIEKLGRTTTIFDATGGYSKTGKKMVMVSFTVCQYADLMNAVSRIDKYAFVTIHRAHEINGEGWTR
ncbi:MAG: YitT family protein, partial [Clostridia bacterium]|nr:YitT family protein [Clostridia bacterium]